MYEVEFYDTSSGRCPTIEFLSTLEPKMRAKALRTIDLLEKNGIDLRMPYSEYISDDIFELRIKQATNIVRLFYFFVKGKRIVITNGNLKKRKKLLKTDFELARKYKMDYERRCNDEQL